MEEEIIERPFPAMVSEIINDTTLVINRGSNDGVKRHDGFVIYRKGKEIIDPETNKSLGELEIVVGYGMVAYVQDQMATIVSSKKQYNGKRIIRKPNINWIFSSEEEEIIGDGTTVPFEDPQIGDLAKFM